MSRFCRNERIFDAVLFVINAKNQYFLSELASKAQKLLRRKILRLYYYI